MVFVSDYLLNGDDERVYQNDNQQKGEIFLEPLKVQGGELRVLKFMRRLAMCCQFPSLI